MSGSLDTLTDQVRGLVERVGDVPIQVRTDPTVIERALTNERPSATTDDVLFSSLYLENTYVRHLDNSIDRTKGMEGIFSRRSLAENLKTDFSESSIDAAIDQAIQEGIISEIKPEDVGGSLDLLFLGTDQYPFPQSLHSRSEKSKTIVNNDKVFYIINHKALQEKYGKPREQLNKKQVKKILGKPKGRKQLTEASEKQIADNEWTRTLFDKFNEIISFWSDYLGVKFHRAGGDGTSEPFQFLDPNTRQIVNKQEIRLMKTTMRVINDLLMLSDVLDIPIQLLTKNMTHINTTTESRFVAFVEKKTGPRSFSSKDVSMTVSRQAELYGKYSEMDTVMHEWFHAFQLFVHTNKASVELRKALLKLNSITVNQSDYMQRIIEFSRVRGGQEYVNYLTNPIEMQARAFAVYVQKKISKKTKQEQEFDKVRPTFSELSDLGYEKAFDELFNVIRFERDHTGKVYMYSLLSDEQIKNNTEAALGDAEVQQTVEVLLGPLARTENITTERFEADKLSVASPEKTAVGFWDAAKKIIYVASGFGVETTTHEAMHAVFSNLKNLLTHKQFLYVMNEKKFKDRYGNFSEEAVTSQLQEWMKKKQFRLVKDEDGNFSLQATAKEAPSARGSFFRSILDFFIKVRNKIAGRGFMVRDDFFQAFVNGEFGRNFEEQKSMAFQFSKPGSVEAEINRQMGGLKEKDTWFKIVKHLGIEEAFNKMGSFVRTGRSIVTEKDLSKLEILKAQNMLKGVADVIKSVDGNSFRTELATVYWMAERMQDADRILKKMGISEERHADFNEAAGRIRDFFHEKENELIRRGLLKPNYGKFIKARIKKSMLNKLNPAIADGTPESAQLAEMLFIDFITSPGETERNSVLNRVRDLYEEQDRRFHRPSLRKYLLSLAQEYSSDKYNYEYVHMAENLSGKGRADFLTRRNQNSHDWLMKQESGLQTAQGERVPILQLKDIDAVEGIMGYVSLFTQAVAEDKTFESMFLERALDYKQAHETKSGAITYVIPDRLKDTHISAFPVFMSEKTKRMVVRKDVAELYMATKHQDYQNTFQKTLSLVKMLQFIQPHILPMYDTMQAFFAGVFMTPGSMAGAAVGGTAGLMFGPMGGVLGGVTGMLAGNKHLIKAFKDFSEFSPDWQKGMELGRDSTVQHDPLNRVMAQTRHEIGTRRSGAFGTIKTAAGGYAGAFGGMALGSALAGPVGGFFGALAGIGLGGASAAVAFKQMDHLNSSLSNLFGDIISPFKEEMTGKNMKRSALGAWNIFLGTVYNYSFETAWTLDSIIRQSTYNALTSKGFSPEQAAHMAAQFHGHYANVPVKTRRFLNQLIFTPTFKIAMANTFSRMLIAPVNAMVQGREGPDYQKNMLYTWGAVRLAGIVAGMDIFMTSMMGFERDEYGRRYRRLVETEKGNREIVVSLANPANLVLKYMHAGRRVTSPFNDNVWSASFKELSYDIHPVYRLAMESLNISVAPTYETLEDGKYKLAKGAIHFLRGSIGLFQTIAGPKTRMEDQEIMVRELTNFSDMWLNNFGFMYLRRDTRDRVNGRITAVKRNLSSAMRRAVEKGASEEEKARLVRTAETLIGNLEVYLEEIENQR